MKAQDASVGPTTYLSFEGGYLFSDGDHNVHFDPSTDKLGNLDPLRPGGDGGQFRFELGQVFDSGWDYKVAVGAILLGNDKSSSDYDFAPGPVGTSTAKEDLTIGIVDLELGFHPEADLGGLDLRVFGGVRAIHASNEATFQTSDNFDDKAGTYEDDVVAGGPRIGLDLTMPVSDQHQIALVGSLSGSVLFGERSSDEKLQNGIGTFENDFSESETVWNVDAMAGFQMAVGERAALTIGYKGQQFGDLAAARSDVEKTGDYDRNGSKDVLVHGPFAKLTVAIPPH
ncbi:MAG: hypothetical protein H7X89_05800 [Rhizobiales bacterium]|nr:hypothetical protein [Hyphomicrobiales bacterium]